MIGISTASTINSTTKPIARISTGSSKPAMVRARRLARATMRNIRQNLFFSFLFNGIGVPIAAGALYPVGGILLSPMLAGAAMALSSVTVVVNALRLNAVKL